MRGAKMTFVDACNSVQKALVLACLDSEDHVETTQADVEAALTLKRSEVIAAIMCHQKTRQPHFCDVSDDFISKIAYLCPQLQVLNVGGCTKVTDASIMEIAKSCFRLAVLGR